VLLFNRLQKYSARLLNIADLSASILPSLSLQKFIHGWQPVFFLYLFIVLPVSMFFKVHLYVC
jgi:hypothetical protein